MYLVGLTGGIGSGKSTVAAGFSARGAVVVDADRIAREIVEPGELALTELVERFGDDILRPDGTLDRPALAAIAFADDDARAALNAITHPRISQRLADRMAELAAADDTGDPTIVVLDIPLLVESRLYEQHDALVVVTAPPEIRLERLVSQRGMDESDVRARMATQLTDEDRRINATHIIDNSGDRAALERRIDEVWSQLTAAAEAAHQERASS
ncbi:MAG: dephospho-CoA kinase, long form [Actinobacteria bacterium]|nr:dephospho-CoA kinase, long form [Actinomycetota bacterium]